MKKTEKPEGAKPVTLTPEEYEKLLAQAQELETLREKFLRNAADFDNARKRLAKEREEFVKFSQERLIREALPILDNLERALAHWDETDFAKPDAVQSLNTGLQMILKQLLNVLESHGLKRFSSQGEPFDPHRHEAVGQVEEEGPEDVVQHEISPGYLLHDRVLRPAKVRIRVKKGEAKEEPDKEDEIT